MLKLTDLTSQNCPYTGWLLYTKQESIRNRRYIDFYRKACEKYGISLKLGIYEPETCRDIGVPSAVAISVSDAARPAFVINRTRDARLAAHLERLGIRVYNNSQIAELGNDKEKACRFMENLNIPMMPTIYGTQSALPFYPAVAKACGGHGGTEVYFINDEKSWTDWLQNVRQPHKKYIVQQVASDLGRDVRVYIVGNKIYAALLRTSRDFRSNVCLGGQAQLYELNAAQRSLVQRILAHLDIGMAGIDFLFHNGTMVFNEIEDMAGARSLYALTDDDIADAYIKYIVNE